MPTSAYPASPSEDPETDDLLTAAYGGSPDTTSCNETSDCSGTGGELRSGNSAAAEDGGGGTVGSGDERSG